MPSQAEHFHSQGQISALAQRIDIASRLARFDIDATTRANLQLLMPDILSGIDRIVVRFYEFLNRFPDTRAILASHSIDQLRLRQKNHWVQLFACDFSVDYVERSLMVGFAHFRAKVAPHVYIAGYNFFLMELYRHLRQTNKGQDMEAAMLSVNKVIMFDMSMALNAYVLDVMGG